MQKFILPEIHDTGQTITIEGQDAKHITRVLRMTKGDMLSLTNGRGRDFEAKIETTSKTSLTATITKSIESACESNLAITLCSAMLKDKKMDMIIKHVTQLGIVKWHPFFCERSVPSPNPEKLKKRKDRWQSIAAESVKQCRRSLLPEIMTPSDFATVLSENSDADLKLMFSENAALPFSEDIIDNAPATAAILIGPEGGFTKDEIAMAKAAGFCACLMGPRILRAETAAIITCGLVQHTFGDI